MHATFMTETRTISKLRNQVEGTPSVLTLAALEALAMVADSMIGENRQLLTDEPVEVHQDFRKIIDPFRGIYRRIYPNFIRKTEGCHDVTGWTCKH
jgi:hypothetical protein